MLCEMPIPKAPRNDVPAAWNGVTGRTAGAGAPTQRHSAAAASTANGASTAATSQPDTAPTTRVPRTLSHVAPQRSPSASTQAPDGAHQPFQAEGAAGDGEIQDRHQRPQPQAAPGGQRPHLAMTAGRSLDLTRVLNAGRSVSSTALSRSSCAWRSADSCPNTATAWSVGGASALPTTLASALMRLLSRIGKLSGSSPLWFLTW